MDRADMTDKAVLVTGSSRGIGLATARAFLDRGARVAVNGRTAASVNDAMAHLGDGGRLAAVPGDLGTPAGCKAVVAAAVEQLGGLDVLVNSAGVFVEAAIEDCDEDIWEKQISINLKGSFFCTREALPALRRSGGNVVNLASDAGLLGYANSSVYCVSKSGVVGMTRALALELAPRVRVNCVCPGWVDTDMAREQIDAAPDPAVARREMETFAPMKRMARPEEVARAIIYLASSDAAFITGVALPIDGGETAGR